MSRSRVRKLVRICITYSNTIPEAASVDLQLSEFHGERAPLARRARRSHRADGSTPRSATLGIQPPAPLKPSSGVVADGARRSNDLPGGTGGPGRRRSQQPGAGSRCHRRGDHGRRGRVGAGRACSGRAAATGEGSRRPGGALLVGGRSLRQGESRIRCPSARALHHAPCSVIFSIASLA